VSRRLSIVFSVDADCGMSDSELFELGEQIVAQQIDPDPPVLTFESIEIDEVTDR
jgi:hypothetical protein